ncbi:uncharacterized protein B0I36DRAFT_19034 [Microdochium trichocladiopsis]|uniref:2EXR domain-containing protein n=1 Tax=Microdochium trichocladiopsis TaxID=1682393 RepID=A0A9P8YIF4_9PEZI|nr:uncharacterized protein B0I36DRAFT_19034 [Microdochium trichocladiopsis]KAH7041076.1 hypothetical protein B0I36DRAFT_19034 [Microdochium trichocladiopsis]
MSTYYEFRMLNLPARYGLSAKSQAMLKAHDDFTTSRITEAELGRLVRLSKDNRTAMVETMVKVSEIMAKKPEESTHCLAVIKTCGEIIAIADKPVPTSGFPYFFKLPPEVRQNVYQYYLRSNETTKVLIPHPKKPGGCWCAPHDNAKWMTFTKKSVAALGASKRLREEIHAALYQRYTFHYPCACEMGRSLDRDIGLMENVRSIKFHWCGPQADTAILKLKQCTSLESLCVVISRSTTRHLTKREQSFRPYFGHRTKALLTDALGVDELLQLRGLKKVEVCNVDRKRADQRNSDDRACLAALLLSRLKLPRKDNDETAL